MTVEALKSTTITNLDASPIVANTAGEGGAAGRVVCASDYSTASASASVTSTYRLVRVPSNCKIKNIFFESEAQTQGTFDIGLYYSSSPIDNALLGVVVPSCQTLFASAVDCTSIVRTDCTNESTNFNLLKRNQPLWQAAGLTTDPGGFFDIVATVVSVAVTTGTGKLGVVVYYTA